jgi:hypothetical protein
MGSCEHGNESSGSIKAENLTSQLSTSQEGLCFMGSVSQSISYAISKFIFQTFYAFYPQKYTDILLHTKNLKIFSRFHVNWLLTFIWIWCSIVDRHTLCSITLYHKIMYNEDITWCGMAHCPQMLLLKKSEENGECISNPQHSRQWRIL